jgi:predicted Ser/Thr protein kinase
MAGSDRYPPPSGGFGFHGSADSLGRGLPEHYVVEGEIGRGGMGTVLKAYDRKHGRQVAIKILRPEVAQTYGRDRFLREIRTAAGLMHANIVALFDSGEVGGTLYFVMPYIEGESLRERLNREKRLSTAEAVRIASAVAGALHYAHGQGVIHRDIKPENIMLARDGHVWIVDFGVARAASEASSRLTHTGVLLGSPLYASPEQLEGGEIDHRTDIYSLGCVLYEMLAGAPPFHAPSMQAVLFKHLTDRVKSLRETVPTVPAALDAAVLRALSKGPSDRFETASEFHESLSNASHLLYERSVGSIGRMRRPIAFVVAMAVATSIAWVISKQIKWSGGFGLLTEKAAGDLPQLDSTRFLILPFTVDSGLQHLDGERLLADALTLWTGIEVLNSATVSNTEVETLTRAVGSDSISALTRRLNAGRFVTSGMSQVGDTVRLSIDLRDGSRPTVILNKLRLSYHSRQLSEKTFRDVADSLLLRGVADECTAGGAGTRHVAVVHACDAAFSALHDGDLVRTDSMLSAALRLEPSYVRAALWLAETRNWVVGEPSNNRQYTVIALSDSTALTKRERLLARAQDYLSANQFSRACDIYSTLTAADSADFVAWLGIGECHRRDDIVLPDHTSRSGWKFRSSYHRAFNAYARAFEIRPTLLAAYRTQMFASVRQLFFTSASSLKTGRASHSSAIGFRAFPALEDDTLAFVPWRADDLSQARVGRLPTTIEAAADRNREVFRGLVMRWKGATPHSATASEALAVAYELGSDRRAVEAIQEARSAATDEETANRLAVMHVWLLIKFAIPDDRTAIRTVRRMADSILAASRNPSESTARWLLPLAVLLGRGNQAAQLARLASHPISTRVGYPATVVEPARAALVFAALGGPRDSIQRNEHEFELALRNALSPDIRAQARAALLGHAIMVALPEYEMAAFRSLSSSGVFTRAQLAYLNGDTAGTRAVIDSVVLTRAGLRPSEISIDGAFTEAWLRRGLGDRLGAIAVLDSTLSALRWFPPGRLDDFVRVGAMMRALALRADLANESGDVSGAKRWAAPVGDLWSAPDPVFTTTTNRMRQYSRHDN